MDKFPKKYNWMAGRQVFERPESNASTMAKRDIINSLEGHDKLTEVHVRTTLARRALSPKAIEQEIQEMNERDRQNPFEGQ